MDQTPSSARHVVPATTNDNEMPEKVINPGERIDALTDPRSAFKPIVLDSSDYYSENRTREFLKGRICACWDLFTIGTFFSALRNSTQGPFPNGLVTFQNFSITSLTIVWRLAQKLPMSKARSEIGSAIAEASRASNGESRSSPDYLANIVIQAFRILSQRPHLQHITSPNTDSNMTPPATAPRKAASGSQQTKEENKPRPSTPASQNSPNALGANTPKKAQPQEPIKVAVEVVTPAIISSEMPSPGAVEQLANLDAKVAEAILQRDNFLLDQLHKTVAIIENNISIIDEQETRAEKAKEALSCIEKLGSCLDVIGKASLTPGGTRQALKTLEEEARSLCAKRPRDYALESATLREDQKRIKTQIYLIEKQHSAVNLAVHSQKPNGSGGRASAAGSK
ncbi:unnamed protein product [Clonostachys rosea]|uniref:Uncharacterized protein n=1 Tax=Bionectria ochroleuca TaxID=29856 RepID=A0ABY6UYL9_BIOOC|nr:unnamed protein product [Clonostachys rosea]